MYNRIQEDSSLADILNQCRESALDIGQSKLMENVEAGKEASIFFLLKTLGKQRGFIEKQIVDLNDSREKETEYEKFSRSALEEIAALGIKTESN